MFKSLICDFEKLISKNEHLTYDMWFGRKCTLIGRTLAIPWLSSRKYQRNDLETKNYSFTISDIILFCKIFLICLRRGEYFFVYSGMRKALPAIYIYICCFICKGISYALSRLCNCKAFFELSMTQKQKV